jgi:hypothetical protein
MSLRPSSLPARRLAAARRRDDPKSKAVQTYARTRQPRPKNWDGTYSLVGHNWFFSAPHSGVFLTLARTEESVSCFVVAGLLPDGTRNRPRIQRLKVSLHISLASPAKAFVKGSR